ncbi:replication initiator protein A [Staphylococcus aureus]
MPNFEKYNLSQVKTERFYQLPKYLFGDAYFKKMSAEAKIMYALLKDRFELSIQNEWVDRNNNIYFIFSNKHLCEYLVYGQNHIEKVVINFNLLTQVRVGLNKPNRLYLLKPNYDIEASLTKELPNSQFQNNESGKLLRTVNLSGQELPNSQLNDTELNNTNYIENEDNDTYDMNDIISNTLINNNHHSNHTNHQKTEFNNDALKFQSTRRIATTTSRLFK